MMAIRAMKPVSASPYRQSMEVSVDKAMQAMQAIATSLYNRYTDLIMDTFHPIYCDWLDDDDIDEEQMHRSLCKAAASTDLAAIITALEALAAIPGSNIYAVPCEEEHWEWEDKVEKMKSVKVITKLRILVNVRSRHGATIADTRLFVEPGSDLGDEDLANLAVMFFNNNSFMCDALKNTVYKYHPDVAVVANMHDKYFYDVIYDVNNNN
jgi:hypothetical protein